MEHVGKAARILDATNNRLASLPPSLGSLPSLQRLIVASNQLTALPREISALTNLKARRACCPCRGYAECMHAHTSAQHLCHGGTPLLHMHSSTL